MRKQEIIGYNKVNLEDLSSTDRETILNDYTELEPYYYKCNIQFHWYKKVPGGTEVIPCKPTKYICTVLSSDGNMWQFGFDNRNRLRNRIKQVQSINEHILAKVIAIREV